MAAPRRPIADVRSASGDDVDAIAVADADDADDDDAVAAAADDDDDEGPEFSVKVADG